MIEKRFCGKCKKVMAPETFCKDLVCPRRAEVLRAAQLDQASLEALAREADEKWVPEEQAAFSAWAIRKFPNESSKGLISLGSAFKLGQAFAIAQARAQPAAAPIALSVNSGEGARWNYQEILRPVLSRKGMQLYLNGDAITLDPSDYRAIIDRAIAAAPAAPHAQAEPVAQIVRIDSVAFEKGERAFKLRKRRDAVPYNGDELREEWFAGYDFASRKTESWRVDLYNEGKRLIEESGISAPAPQEAEQPVPLDDCEVARLRRVVRAMGIEKDVPVHDESLRGCLFSVLGMMARKLEAEQASASPMLPVDLIADFRDAIAVARNRAEHAGDTARKKRWIAVEKRLETYLSPTTTKG